MSVTITISYPGRENDGWTREYQDGKFRALVRRDASGNERRYELIDGTWKLVEVDRRGNRLAGPPGR